MDRIKMPVVFGFQYPFSADIRRHVPVGNLLICSNTVDYDVVLKSTIKDLSIKILKSNNLKFIFTELYLLHSIYKLSKRIVKYPSMLSRKPTSFEEAIQKLLFFNGLFWQAGHWHVGLGRLDVVLYEYYCSDIKNSVITIEEAKMMLKSMIEVINRDVNNKSGLLKGDTGQYILLSGVDANNRTVCNELTILFLEIFSEYSKPDPKLILRVNENTPDLLWEHAVTCILHGSGSPLLMNESVLINSLRGFGYKKEDLYNIGTSACWEPLIIGKSFDQNNSLPSIAVVDVLSNLILSNTNFDTFEELLDEYKICLNRVINKYNTNIKFDVSPLYSLFFSDCIEKGKDFTRGGATYAFHGIEVVSFPNLINSLLNIKQYVFEKRCFSLVDCKNALASNFDGYEDMLELFKSNEYKFGCCTSVVIALSNDIMTSISNMVDKIKINGNKVKVGFSSPSYIDASCNSMASLDGRKKGMPFAVHISPISKGIDFLEIIDFATSLSYENNRINGNVIDFIIQPSYIKNKDKFIKILKTATSKGFFEMQLNILDYKTLMAAKHNPELFPNLIVRVWGFSAYFNDLPVEYKDVLIERAMLYESD